MAGRPSDYSPEIADNICELLAQGKSLVKICQDLDIGYTTVRQWLKAHEEFARNYTLAREDQGDYIADETMDIADDPTIPADEKRIRIDTRKWYAGKLKPKKYGDKTLLGSDPDNPLPASSATISVTPEAVKSIIQTVRDEF